MILCDVCLAIFTANLFILSVASIIAGFPFWGRHMAGAAHFMVIATALILKQSAARSRAAAILAIVMTILMTSSSILARYSPDIDVTTTKPHRQ